MLLDSLMNSIHPCVLELLISLVFSITPVLSGFLRMEKFLHSADDLTVVEPTLNVGLVNIILQEKHEVDLDMSGDTCVNSDENVVFSEDTLCKHISCVLVMRCGVRTQKAIIIDSLLSFREIRVGIFICRMLILEFNQGRRRIVKICLDHQSANFYNCLFQFLNS
jgi:hypothetical protein